MKIVIIDGDINAKNSSVVEFVYSVLKKNILNWNLKPGQRISEKEMSEHFGVSKTPVRESFIRLEKEKLIDILPQRGSFVSKIDLKDVNEGLFIRRSLELSVLELAVAKLTEEALNRMRDLIQLQQQSILKENYVEFFEYDVEFHKEIFTRASRERTWTVMSEANTQYSRLRLLSLMDIDKYEMLIAEHRELISALEKRNLRKAKQVMKDHIGKLHFEEKILKTKYPDYFI